jgi:CrcB protein
VDIAELKTIGLVAVGGAMGSVARYLLSGVLTRDDFPWGTAAVNIVGSFLLALLFFMSLQQGGSISADGRAFLFIGLLGGFTTTSTFTLETVAMMADSEWATASANIFANVVLCLGGAVLGRAVGIWAVGG